MHFHSGAPMHFLSGVDNGRAAAIECYLDVGASPTVRWTSYSRELDIYQGELVGKTDFMRRFYEIGAVDGSYDLSKISAVVNMLISECGAMQEANMLSDLKKQIENEFGASDDDEGED